MFVPRRIPRSWGWVVRSWVEQPLEGTAVWLDLAPRTPLTPYGRAVILTWGDEAAVASFALPRSGFSEFVHGIARLEWDLCSTPRSERMAARSKGYRGPDIEIDRYHRDDDEFGITVIEVERRTLCEVPTLSRWPARLGWLRQTGLEWVDPGAADYEPGAERAGCRFALTFETGEVVLRLVPEWATSASVQHTRVGRWLVSPDDAGGLTDRELAAVLEGLRWSLR